MTRDRWTTLRLGDIADFVTERIETNSLDTNRYVGVENLIANCGGVRPATSLPEGRAIAFRRGDVLIGNIRPYLKKAWLADRNGGTNGDVLTLRAKGPERILPSFLYYALSSDAFFHYLNSNARGAKMPRGDKWSVLQYRVPLPPLSEQARIVRILDTFREQETALEQELEAELKARTEQYHYYRERLLTEIKGARVRLGDIGELIRGNGLQKSDFAESGFPCIHYGQIYTHYGTFASETKSFVPQDKAKRLRKARPGDLVIATTSENIEDVCKAVAWLGEGEVAIGGHATLLRHNQNPKYLAYYFQTQAFYQEKLKYALGTKVIEVYPSRLINLELTIPPLPEQARIVGILDRFETSESRLKRELEAELQARRAQYAYWRERLMRGREE